MTYRIPESIKQEAIQMYMQKMAIPDSRPTASLKEVAKKLRVSTTFIYNAVKAQKVKEAAGELAPKPAVDPNDVLSYSPENEARMIRLQADLETKIEQLKEMNADLAEIKQTCFDFLLK